MVVTVYLLVLALYFTAGCSAEGYDSRKVPVRPLKSYCRVVEETASFIEEAVDEKTNTQIFGSTKGFLRFLAFLETKDGERLQGTGMGGLWHVKQETFIKVQNSIYLRTNGSLVYTVPVYHAFQVYFMSPSSVTYADLDKPIVSALFALLDLIESLNSQGFTVEDIPRYPSQQGEFLAAIYGKKFSALFDISYKEFSTYSCNAECRNKMDIVFVLDGSGSIHEDNFKTYLEFASEMSGRYNIGSNQVQVGLMVYSNGIRDQFRLNDHTSVQDIQNAIQGIEYPGGFTYTGKAITQARTVGFSEDFGSRPRSTGTIHIMIVVTEGRSYDDIITPTREAIMKGIEVLFVGVGNKTNNNELLAAAGTSSAHFAYDFESLQQLVTPLYKKTCDTIIAVTADSELALAIPKGRKQNLKLFLELDITQSVLFSSSVASSDFTIYGSLDYKFPGSTQYDYAWNTSGGKHTFSTRLPVSRSRNHFYLNNMQVFYASVSSSRDITLLVRISAKNSVNNDDLSCNLKQLPSEVNSLKYQCTINCNCVGAYVTWEREGFNNSLPELARITSAPDGRSSILLLDTTLPNYHGEYKCIVRSPHILGYQSLSVQLYQECLNGGTHINPRNCLCSAQWTGKYCEESSCTVDYYVGYSKKWHGQTGTATYLFAAAESSGIIHVLSSDGSDRRVTFLNEGEPLTIKLLKNDNYHIRVSSAKTVSLFGAIFSRGSSAAFSIFPSSSLEEYSSNTQGQRERYYRYFGVSVASTYQYLYSVQPEGIIHIIGTAANTIVRITFPRGLQNVKVYRNKDYRTQYSEKTFIIGLFETLTISSRADLTGIEIISSNPVSVYSGHECGNLPQRVRYCDHLLEQMPPTHVLGRDYIVSSFMGRRDNSHIKLLAVHNHTGINISCNIMPSRKFILNSSQIREFAISVRDVCIIQASHPLMVVEFSRGQGHDVRGDPAMVILRDLTSFGNQSQFNSFPFDRYMKNYVNIIAPKAAKDNGLIMIDGRPISSRTPVLRAPIVNGEEFVILRMEMTKATFHKVETVGGRYRFGLVAYGLGPASGYAYTTNVKGRRN
jgi:hypothetical protein